MGNSRTEQVRSEGTLSRAMPNLSTKLAFKELQIGMFGQAEGVSAPFETFIFLPLSER